MTNQHNLHPQPTDPSAPHIATVYYGTGVGFSPITNAPAAPAATEVPAATNVGANATPTSTAPASGTDAPATIGSAIKTMVKTKSGSKDMFEAIAVEPTFIELVKRRKAWEAGSYAASNNELYALLADCLDIYLAFRSHPSLCKDLNTQLTERNIAFNAGTSLPLKIVRLAFIEPGMEEKTANRAYGYARVIKIAADNEITGKGLAKFIADHNGIDEIRRTTKDGRTTAQVNRQYEERADRTLATKPPITTVEMTKELAPADGERFSIALIRRNANNTGSIVFATNNVALVNSALRHAGKHLEAEAVQQYQDDVQQQKKQIEAQNRQNAKAIAKNSTNGESTAT